VRSVRCRAALRRPPARSGGPRSTQATSPRSALAATCRRAGPPAHGGHAAISESLSVTRCAGRTVGSPITGAACPLYGKPAAGANPGVTPGASRPSLSVALRQPPARARQTKDVPRDAGLLAPRAMEWSGERWVTECPDAVVISRYRRVKDPESETQWSNCRPGTGAAIDPTRAVGTKQLPGGHYDELVGGAHAAPDSPPAVGRSRARATASVAAAAMAVDGNGPWSVERASRGRSDARIAGTFPAPSARARRGRGPHSPPPRRFRVAA
jgi:hypothetical protein